METLKGRLINLRRLRRTDVADFQPLADDPRVYGFLPHMPSPYTPEDARRWVNETHRNARKGTEYHFGIEHRDGRIIGTIGLQNIVRPDGNAEVGYWVAPKFWRRGYASEALRLILNYAFTDLNMYRVYAIVSAKNRGSVAVLEKAGFTCEGIFRKAHLSRGRRHDVYFYAMLKAEFRRR